MYTRKVYLKEEHALVLQKVNFEARIAISNLQFMIDQHLEDKDDSYTESDQFADLLEDFMFKYLQAQEIRIE